MSFNNKQKLKQFARKLRCDATDAERLLWYHLRRKQLKNIQFYRQRPIGNYIVDFYAPSGKIVIEVDGSQHFEEENLRRDQQRDIYLAGRGLKVLRFDNLEVLQNTKGVLEVIYNNLSDQ